VALPRHVLLPWSAQRSFSRSAAGAGAALGAAVVVLVLVLQGGMACQQSHTWHALDAHVHGNERARWSNERVMDGQVAAVDPPSSCAACRLHRPMMYTAWKCS
jgi:hypothetical protein